MTFDSGNSPTIPVVHLWGIPLWGICGMKCSHTGHTLPHRLLLLLKPGNKTSREVFPPLLYPRGITTSTHNLGELSTPREDITQLLTILGDYHPLERIITSPLVDFGLLHQYVEKSDLLSIFGVIHPLPLFPTIIRV